MCNRKIGQFKELERYFDLIGRFYDVGRLYNSMYSHIIENDEMPWKYCSEKGMRGGIKEI